MTVRTASAADAAGMAAVHVGVWQTAYAGILPDHYLAGLSASRQAAFYQQGLHAGRHALVAEAAGRVVGFVTMSLSSDNALGQSEIETLYVGDDWREQGIGRRLMQGAGETLAGLGAGSVFLWVLSSNGSQWFYQRLGGRRVAEGQARVAGTAVPKTAYAWDPITLLLPTVSPR